MTLDIKNKTYEKFGRILIDDVLGKLTGAHPTFERIYFDKLPSDDILIGSLAGVIIKDKQEDEEINNNPIFPNSLTVKFLLDNFTSEINLDLEFFVYYRVYPTYHEQKKDISDDKINISFSTIWKREKIKIPIVFDKNTNEISLSHNISKYLNKIYENNELLRYNSQFKVDLLENEESYNNFISKEKNNRKLPPISWDVSLLFDNHKFTQDDKKYDLVEITLVNNTVISEEENKNKMVFDPFIFNPILKIGLGDNNFKQFKYLYPKTTDKFYSEDLRCLNCHGDYYETFNMILTKNFGVCDKKKTIPKNGLANVDISFKKLSSVDGIGELEKIYYEMNKFYENSSRDDVAYDDFYSMKERFNDNIQFLKNHKIASKAFYLMNKTFERNSEKSSYHSWRLFQIVFIVSQLKDIVLGEDRDTCELLHVMTGGGKSESYFGIVVFTAFFDRLSGKKFGVSGVTKFPLRMLSVQQLQRISNIFIFAEEVRKDEGVNDDPFSIAYFVGSQESDFPTHNVDFLNKIRDAKNNHERIHGQIIDKCPICDGEVYLDIDEKKKLVIHKCHSCDREYRLYFSDDEIYRTLPTFIISTVDKWAGIALNRRFKNLLGGKLDLCEEHGFIPRNDKCDFRINSEDKKCNARGKEVFVDFDTSPTLIIQDEMHLIKEGFGTIDSHFESLIENMKLELYGSNKFKNIVMTATVSGADTQIEHLYHKKTRIFPPTLKDSEGNTFFFFTEKEDGKEVIQRRIIGLKSSIQNFKLIFKILKHVSEFFFNIEKDLNEFALNEGFDYNELKIIIKYYKNLLTYHNKKEAVHSIRYSIYDYVNTYENLYEVQTDPLTGENSLEDIKEIISKVQNFYCDEENKDKIYAVNSTSIVSHGVDIDKWNCMIFDGMPRSTSEYIQALSRVGRKYFGIVFVSFSPMRTRDLSYYQHFNEYHEILDDKVEDVPISRWAKLGFKQTFTSIFNAAILNYLSNEIEKPLYFASDVINALKNEENKNKLINFIKKAYISDSEMLGSKYFDEHIEEEVNYRIEKLNDYPNSKFFPGSLKRNPNRYLKTQHGMRGIQDEIVLEPIESDDHFYSIYKGD